MLNWLKTNAKFADWSKTKAAAAAAKEARDEAQRLQLALEAMGFTPRWATAALRVTARRVAEAAMEVQRCTKAANRDAKVWHGATETGPWMMDKC